MDHDHKECDRTPPAVNWKCIFFTFALAGGYWFLPPKNKWVLLALLYFPYLVLAIYDHHYGCIRNNLSPTYLALFYSWAKPQDSQQIKVYKNWCPDIKNKVFIVDMVVLAVLIALAPAFLSWKPS